MPPESNILVIDDEEVVLDSCAAVLTSANCRVITANNGAKGLQQLEQLTPDLIFLDLKMPGMSGMEVLERIHARDPLLVVIVITGYATVASAIEAMKKGAFDFLPKPFTPEELRLIARRGLEHGRLLRQTGALRRQQEMLRENFAAIVSHELKAPLGALQQSLYGLVAELEDKLTEEQKQRFARLQARLNDLLKLIHSWLRVFAVDIQRLKDAFQPVRLADLVARAVETVQPHAVRKNLEIQIVVPDILPVVQGEPGSLTEVLVNLLNNAVKYSFPNGLITVRGEVHDGQVLLSVADTGVGIAPEDLPHLFQDFGRGKNQPEGASGCGLGLAISQRIVEVHGGTITVASQPGQGSTFTVHLPVTPPPVSADSNPQRKA